MDVHGKWGSLFSAWRFFFKAELVYNVYRRCEAIELVEFFKPDGVAGVFDLELGLVVIPALAGVGHPEISFNRIARIPCSIDQQVLCAGIRSAPAGYDGCCKTGAGDAELMAGLAMKKNDGHRNHDDHGKNDAENEAGLFHILCFTGRYQRDVKFVTPGMTGIIR
jgi:hypothetical protein